MTEHYQVFLSYSRNDFDAATVLLSQLESAGLSVFRDQDSIREGDNWLQALQQAVDHSGSFVVLVGRDGVRRWMGAETEVALVRHIDPHHDGERLPIFPILLDGLEPESLIAFLRRFQVTRWNASDALPPRLIQQIQDRTLVPSDDIRFEGCPYVGLNAFRPDQAQLFFGRQKETLDALASFDTRSYDKPVKWLEVRGNSGAGKSSLMNAGMLPLIVQGWLFGRTGFAEWRVIGPMMPGERPVGMLAEQLARAFSTAAQTLEMGQVRQSLQADDRGLADWLRSRKHKDTAFLLAIDQFEELFTFADDAERQSFDRLLATALEDSDCPLFVLSTIRADFVDQYDSKLPQLQAVLNRFGKSWSLPLIGGDGLREVIRGPAALAGLDVSEVQEAMIAEAGHEPGALPLVENALNWLWEQREDGRLSGRLLTGQGGLAGILSRNADTLLDSLGARKAKALELLFQLLNVDPEGRVHTRRRLSLEQATEIAGGGEAGVELINRLAGTQMRDGHRVQAPLRLITVADGWVNLIHETLIRTKGADKQGVPQPYWPTLWRYADRHKDRAAIANQLRHQQQAWSRRGWLGRLVDAANWRELRRYARLPKTPGEQRFMRFSRWVMGAKGALLGAFLTAAIAYSAGLLILGKYGLPNGYLPHLWAYWLGRPPMPALVPIPPVGPLDRARDGPANPAPAAFAASEHLEMGAYEITFLEYDFFVLATGRLDKKNRKPAIPPDESWGRNDRPVINVYWQDAYDYTQWLSESLADEGKTCRLPTEQEWEHAARAGTGRDYGIPAPEGSDDIANSGLANCDGCGSRWDNDRTAPVGSFPANAWGLHDMHGNVWEWCVNEYENPENTDPGGNASRVLRGGSWGDYPDDARASHRYGGNPDNRHYGLGFRVVCSSPISH